MHLLSLLITALLPALPAAAQSWSGPPGEPAPARDALRLADVALGITRLEDISFGSIIPNSGGTVSLRPQGNHRSTTGSLVLMSTPPARCARFLVTGEKNAMYTVMLPSSAVITRGSGAETMTVGAFSLKSDNSNKLQGNGWDRFSVGATLTVGAAQRGGAYTGVWFVTVAYE
jgi:hypothetical protein